LVSTFIDNGARGVRLCTKFSEYWLASLKVIAVIMFIIIGVLVNVGINPEHRYIGGENWRLPGAPFVGGFGGFARVFVTASFACKLWCFSPVYCYTINCLNRWWNGEFGYHGWRDKESF